MARKAKADAKSPAGVSEDSVPETIFDHMARNNPPPAAAPSPQVDVDGLLKQIADLKSSQERLERTNMALMSAPPQPQWSMPAPQAPAPAPVPLPDPALDAEGYGRALTDRITGQIMGQMSAQQAQQARQQAEASRIDALWESFGDQYPEMVEYPELVEAAATKVLKDMAVRGVDVTKYMTVASDRFFEDVASRMKKDYGKLLVEDADTAVPSKAHAAAVQRTAGVFGGQDTGGAPAKPAEAKKGDMVEDLIAMQKKDGYF